MFGTKGFILSTLVTTLLQQHDGKLLIGGAGFVRRLNADGTTDTTFKTYQTSYDAFTDLAVLPDGRVLVSGFAELPGGSAIPLAGWNLFRLASDGTREPGFREQSPNESSANWFAESSRAIHLLEDGSVLVAGTAFEGQRNAMADRDLALARYLPDGRLDAGFGVNGLATAGIADLGSDTENARERGYALFAQSNGKFVVAGTRNSSLVELARFDERGQLDRGFGINGAVIYQPRYGSSDSFAAAQAGDRVMVALSGVGNGYSIEVTRFTADGQVDTAFGRAGHVLVDVPGLQARCDAMAVQADGKIVLGGKVLDIGGGKAGFLLMRLNADGTLDATFGEGGRLVRTVDGLEPGAVTALLIQDDGQILVAAGQPLSYLLRVDATGHLDGQAFEQGTAGADLWTGGPNVDLFDGLQGNDTLQGAGGSDAIRGGDGVDTAVYAGVRAEYGVLRSGGTVTVGDTTPNRDATDTLIGVERLKFADGLVALDIGGNAGQAFRLYQAAFDRAPDVGGLGFQINALDSGHTLLQVAQNFIDSPEFAGRYGALNDLQFVTQLYANVLDRAPDEGGLAYHTGNLAAGMSRAQVLVGFSESPENQANVIGAIENGIFYTL